MAAKDYLGKRNNDIKNYWNVGNIHKSMQTTIDCKEQRNFECIFPQKIVAAPLFIDRYPIPSFKSTNRCTFKKKYDKNIQTTLREDAIYTEAPHDKRKHSKKFEKTIGNNLIKNADQIKSIVVFRDNVAAILSNRIDETHSKPNINPEYVKLATEIHKSIRRMNISNKPPKPSVKSVIVVNVDDDSDYYSCHDYDQRAGDKRSSTGFAEKVKNHIVCEVLESIHAGPPVDNVDNESSSRKRWSINPLSYLGFGREEQNTQAISESHSTTSNETEPQKGQSSSIADEFRAMCSNLATTIISIPTVGARVPGQDCVPRPRKKCRKCKQNPFCCHGPKCEFKDPVIAIQRPKCKKGGAKGCVYLAERANLCPKCPPPSTCDPNKSLNCYSCDFCDHAYPQKPRDSSIECQDHGRIETTPPRETSCPLRPTKEQCRACEEKKRRAILHRPTRPVCPPSELHHHHQQQHHQQEKPVRSPSPTPDKYQNYQYTDRSAHSISYSDDSEETRQPEKRDTPTVYRKSPYDPSKYACEPEISKAEQILNLCNDLVEKGKGLASSLTHQVCKPLQKPTNSVCGAACPRREPPPEDPCCEITDTFDRMMCNMAYKGAKVVKAVVNNCGSAIAPDEHRCKRPLPTVDGVTKKVVETFGSAFCSSNSANSSAPSTKDEEYKPKSVSNDFSDHETRECSLYNTIRSAITDIFADSGTVIKNNLMDDITFIDLSASNETMTTKSNNNVNHNMYDSDSPGDSHFFIC